MNCVKPFLTPPRHLGQMRPVRKAWPYILIREGYPPAIERIGVQVDGFQAVVMGLDSVTTPFGPYVHVDGLQAVILVLET